MKKREISNEVLSILSAGRCDADKFFLPATQLDRKEYEAVNTVLTALGGKWNRGAKAHIFAGDAAERIEGAIETGGYTRPDDMGWFPTPLELARRVVEVAGVSPGDAVLEPSAGRGAIALEAAARGAVVECVEIDGERAGVLRGAGLTVTNDDFLAVPHEERFDCVVMNPPFAKRADIHHVMHAMKFLKPGGRLVSIVSGGVIFREDALTRQFRELCDSIEELPEESFKESGTSVNTALVKITKAA